MSRKKLIKDVPCTIAGEEVHATLKQKFTMTFGATPRYFVDCNEEDCQYLGENMPPCPLSLQMFEKELSDIREKKMGESTAL